VALFRPPVRPRRLETHKRVLGGLTHLDQPSGDRAPHRLAQAHGELGHITLRLGPGKLKPMPTLLTPPEVEVDSAQIELRVVGDLFAATKAHLPRSRSRSALAGWASLEGSAIPVILGVLVEPAGKRKLGETSHPR
jgi:hypothetical protein